MIASFEKDFLEDVEYVMSLLKLELQEKLRIQGYGDKVGSKLQQTMEYEVNLVSKYIIAGMYMEEYYVFVENKTPPDRIPFGKKTGKKVSKYIQALWRYWRLKRGLAPKEALRASFALARKHKQEGRPTRNSYRYSQDGTRTGFIEDTLKATEQRVFEILTRRIGDTVELTLTQILTEFQKQNRLVKER